MKIPNHLRWPGKVLRIETDDTDYTPIETIPEEYRNLVIPAASVFYTHDYDFDMLCQSIRLGPFSLWTHEVFAMENITLLPVTTKPIITLHFMAGSDVMAEITDNGPYKLSGKEVNLFKLDAAFHEAPMKRGDTLFSFHINVLPHVFSRLSRKHPELAQLTQKELTKGSGPLHDRPYKINKVCFEIIQQICGCRYIEMLADKFLYRNCLDLFINFANQDKVSHLPSPKFDPEIMDAVPHAVQFLKENVGEEFNSAKMAYILDVNARELKSAFEAICFISAEQFHFQSKMYQAFKLIVNTKAAPNIIANAIGMRDTGEFIKKFEAYFDCSYIAVRNAQ